MTTKKIPSYRQRIGYHAGLLGGVAFIASMAIGIANIETSAAIKAALEADQKASLIQVIPSKLHDNDLLKDTLLIDGKTVYTARRNNQVIAVAFKTEEPGYSGIISIIMSVKANGEILGVRTLSHTETPGLGDKIEIARNPWVTSFDGKSLDNLSDDEWKVKKDGGVFDQFTGATITPRAYVKAVKAGLDFYAAEKEAILSSPSSIMLTDDMATPSTSAAVNTAEENPA